MSRIVLGCPRVLSWRPWPICETCAFGTLAVSFLFFSTSPAVNLIGILGENAVFACVLKLTLMHVDGLASGVTVVLRFTRAINREKSNHAIKNHCLRIRARHLACSFFGSKFLLRTQATCHRAGLGTVVAQCFITAGELPSRFFRELFGGHVLTR